MAAELQADWTTGSTIYFLVRDGNGLIWNGSAFTAYITANLATYAIAATEQGTASGFYTAGMPAVVAGNYNIVAKERAGGGPAEVDRTAGAGELAWDGTLAGDAYALLAGANTELSSPPAITGSLVSFIKWMFALAKNKRTQTSTTELLRNDADGATIGTAVKSDDGTTFTRGKYS